MIPDKIKIGFQNRNDTYTKKLGYVIWQDSTGKWRKQPSWEGWRDKKIDPVEVDNVPTSGFVLNKGAGRYNSDVTYIRIWDPRDFEFEIDVSNLLFILQECDSGRKGLEGEFVYAWNGNGLVLLPTSSQEYVESAKFTAIQALKVSTTEYKVGHIYLTKDMQKVTYLGRFDYHEPKRNYFKPGLKTGYKWVVDTHTYQKPASWWGNDYKPVKKHLFSYQEDHCDYSAYPYKSVKIDKIGPLHSQNIKKEIGGPVDNIAELIDEFSKSKEAALPDHFELRDIVTYDIRLGAIKVVSSGIGFKTYRTNYSYNHITNKYVDNGMLSFTGNKERPIVSDTKVIYDNTPDSSNWWNNSKRDIPTKNASFLVLVFKNGVEEVITKL